MHAHSKSPVCSSFKTNLARKSKLFILSRMLQNKRNVSTCFLLHTVASMTIYLHTLDAYVKGIMNFVGKREAEAKAEAEEVKHPMLFVCTCYRSVNHTT